MTLGKLFDELYADLQRERLVVDAFSFSAAAARMRIRWGEHGASVQVIDPAEGQATSSIAPRPVEVVVRSFAPFPALEVRLRCKDTQTAARWIRATLEATIFPC